MRRRDWIVIGTAVGIMLAGIGIGLAIRYSRASRRPPGPVVVPHQQRSEQAQQAAAKRAQIVRQQRTKALRNYEKMSPEQQRRFVQDQVRRTFEPNRPPRRIGTAADQNEVARQILEKIRDMTPDQRREYLQAVLEQERAQGGLDPNLLGSADKTVSPSQKPVVNTQNQ